MTRPFSLSAATALLTAAALLLALGVWVVATSGSDDATSASTPVAHTGATVGPRDGGDARPSRGDAAPRTAEPAAARPPAPAEPPPLEDFGAVVAQRPSVRVDGVAADDPLALTLGHQAVRFATVVRTSTVAVRGADGHLHEIRVAAVDPRGFRVLTPQITADAQGLWQHLVDGAAIMDHGAAERLGSQLGGEVVLADRPALRLGGVAALGDPVPADLVVSTETGHRLALEGALSILVATGEVSKPSRVAGELAELLGAEATPLVDDRVVELGVTHVPAGQWDDVWDRLASCESSGRWHLDSGNGYYGGLQFLPESWWWVGGTGMPHEASREEQIARAKILLAYQGWEAWPACSQALGYR